MAHDVGGPWPATAGGLERAQLAIGALRPSPWRDDPAQCMVGGCYVVFGRGSQGPGRAGELGWAAAVLAVPRRVTAVSTWSGPATGPYVSGLLALREGPLLEAAVRSLPEPPDVLLVPASGRDHPRNAGLAVHLGMVLDLPTVGVTDRALVATGEDPGPRRGDRAPIQVDGVVVGYRVRTRPRTRPLVVHAGWRTGAEMAVDVVLATTRRRRAPEPLRAARRTARHARTRQSATRTRS